MRFFLLACLLGFSTSLELLKVQEPVEGEYIVQFKKDAHPMERAVHLEALSGKAIILKSYDFPGFTGYAAKIQEIDLVEVLRSPIVQLVEQNAIMRISNETIRHPEACTTQTGATWGLVRTAEEDLVLTGDYKYESRIGSGIKAYVIDTGIYIGHNDFEGRAIWGSNHVDSDNSDGNGHGTHVAGTIGGATWGLAKGATLVAVKVLGAGGSGTTAGVIAGINWVANDALAAAAKLAKKAIKAVANMSLGGSRSTSLNNAVNAAVDNDILFAVAAGNDYNDACNYSPASAEQAVSVGASDNTDSMAYFSNYGQCVDIFGPGLNIRSAWIGNPNSDNTISGTSMAAPHVAGVAAKIMWENPSFTAERVADFMYDSATSGKLSGIQGSPNLLCYHGCYDR